MPLHYLGKKTRRAFETLLAQALQDEKATLKEQPKRLRKSRKSSLSETEKELTLSENEKALINMAFRMFDKDKYFENFSYR